MLNAIYIYDVDISRLQSILLQWFTAHGRVFPWRQPGLNNYQLVIAEALLQRTRADIVAKHYGPFLRAFPGWYTLAVADAAELEPYIYPLGLAAQRGPKLLALAGEMVRRQGILPPGREQLATIPFFGYYMLNATELLIFHRPVPLLDVNMARLLERYFGLRRRPDLRRDAGLQELAHRVVDHSASKFLSWSILDFATLVCRGHHPLCADCPLNQECHYFGLEVAATH